MPRTYFFWDPVSDNILQERDDDGNVTAEYTTEPGLHGNLISQNRGGVESQYHFDPQGSTLALTDDNQNVTDTYGYNAFGEVTERTGSTVNPFQYIGQKGYYRDNLTGQYLARRRPYEPETARWLTVDDVELVFAGNHAYVYVNNRPVILVDPSGLAPIDDGTGFEQRVIEPSVESPCGAAKANTWWRFELRRDEAKGLKGWVLQFVTLDFSVRNCKDEPVAKKDWSYMEAFEVKDGVVYSGAKEMPPGNDFFSVPDQGKTKGSYTASFCALFIKDYKLKMPPWSKTACPQSRGLPCIPIKFKLTDEQKEAIKDFKVGNAICRGLTASWDCCCDPKKPTELSNVIGWEDTYYGTK
jgi:RHS repeat-associated protein